MFAKVKDNQNIFFSRSKVCVCVRRELEQIRDMVGGGKKTKADGCDLLFFGLAWFV